MQMIPPRVLKVGGGGENKQKKSPGSGRKLTQPSIVLFLVISSNRILAVPSEEDKVTTCACETGGQEKAGDKKRKWQTRA